MTEAARSQIEGLIERGHDAVSRSDDAFAGLLFAEAATRGQGLHASDLLARALAGLAQVERARGAIAEADKLTRQARDALAAAADPVPVAVVEVAIELAGSTDCRDPEAELRRAVEYASAIPNESVRQDATVRALRALGSDQRRRGHYEEAATTLRDALRLATARFGANSLERAGVLNELGVVSKFTGSFADAERCYAEVRAIQDAHGLAMSADRATLLHNLGGLDHARGELVRAETFARQSVELHAQALGEDHLATDLDRIALATILDGNGRSGEAEELLETSIPRLRKRLGTHPEVAVAVNNLGAIFQRAGDLDRAEGCYREALTIKEAYAGVQSPTLAATLNNLGTVLRRKGALEEAAAVYDRAVVLLEGAVASDHPTLEALRRNHRRTRRV